METVVGFLLEFKYLAMFVILVLCGLGLPLPEEVTLLGSGLLVGWGEAHFLPAAAACVGAILIGDSVIFFMGRFYGRRFLQSPFMRWILNRKRQARVRWLFSRHDYQAVFLARFFAGVRIGVYAYAGQHGMRWYKFLFLDVVGVLISGPTSIWVGKFAAEQVGSPQEAIERASELAHTVQFWIWVGVALLLLGFVARFWWKRRRREKQEVKGGSRSSPVSKAVAVTTGAPTEPEFSAPAGKSDPVDR